jgi:hypothetical protein
LFFSKINNQIIKLGLKNILLKGREGGEETGLKKSGEGGELSFQCLRPSTSLMAAGKKVE